LPRFYPGLLTGLAAIIRAFPGAPDRELLSDWLSIYQAACLVPLCVGDSEQIRHANLMYAAIFRGLGALIFAARRDAVFLGAHRDDWVRPMRRFVLELGLFLENETLRAYVFFMHDALDHLPSQCRPALVKVHVRVILICVFVEDDPAIDDTATAIWDNLCAE
jgi:hypothetical protein